MHSPTFTGTFSSNFLRNICVGISQNFYFNIKDPGIFDKCNIPFLNMRKSSVPFVLLVLFAYTLICKQLL